MQLSSEGVYFPDKMRLDVSDFFKPKLVAQFLMVFSLNSDSAVQKSPDPGHAALAHQLWLPMCSLRPILRTEKHFLDLFGLTCAVIFCNLWNERTQNDGFTPCLM